MMRRVRSFAVAGVCAAVLVGVGAQGALSATPRQIYQDYAKHGKLTKHYSKADLQRALSSTLLTGYTHGHNAKPNIQGQIATPPVKAGSGGLPFTGLDLGLMSFGAILLLTFGGVLRRAARAKD
jgi:hypothetical protein